ncbi:replication termination factor 2 [Condylostylus longicornis]|uniref:replication termination factor 2 n=1 Tax=Condylostylus longicornis TaxID=2530218 RepID=UPI00244E52A0|nr:replication termination factor 2 [Condylostylus longicornis]
MGCDGGTIPRRDELVRTKKKPEQKDKDSERQFRWLHCALTQERLQQPIVMCGLGRLYSKQNIIEALLDKEKIPETISHIKSLKDIKDLNLTANPAYKDSDKTEGLLDPRNAPFICKLIGIEMSGKFRFIALWSCGCVFSERAFKQIKTGICALCQTAYSEEDVVILNGTDEEIDQMREKMISRIAKRKTKKNKKAVDTTKSESEEYSEKTSKPSTSVLDSNKLSKKIETQKRNGELLDKMADPEMKKLKTESVAKDPKASEVYKSLFTSHRSEKQQDRAHWVTYNPFYN